MHRILIFEKIFLKIIFDDFPKNFLETRVSHVAF